MRKLIDMRTGPPSDSLVAFFRACDLASGLVGSESVAVAWEMDSVVEGFTVGALAAHLYMAIRLFEAALEKPEPSSDRIGGIADFYSLNRVDERSDLVDSVHAGIRASAADRARQGPVALAEQFDALVERLRSVLDDQLVTRLVPVWRIEGGATHLSDYLATRIVELVVHADDLASSVGMEIDIPEEAASAAFGVFLELARARSGDVAVVRAFARRERGDAEVLRVL